MTLHLKSTTSRTEGYEGQKQDEVGSPVVLLVEDISLEE